MIKWFNNHSFALGLLQHEQTTFHLVVLVLILLVLTRWTSHYLAMDRLVILKAGFLRLVAKLVSSAGAKAADKAKAHKMICFWTQVEK